NAGDGVRVEDSSNNVLVTGNTIADNTGKGIFVQTLARAVTVGGLQEGEPNDITGNGDKAVVFGSGTDHLLLSNNVVGNIEIWAGAVVAGAGEITGAAPMYDSGYFAVINLAEPFSFRLHGDYTQLAGGTTVVTGVTTLDVTGSVTLAGGTLTF